MKKGIETITLTKYSKDDEPVREYGDISFGVLGKDINNGCYVSEIEYYYMNEFGLTTAELRDIKNMAKDLFTSKYYDYTIDLVKKTITKS